MKKKFLILLFIVAIFALPLAACGGEKKAPTTNKLDVADYAIDLTTTIAGQEIYPEPKGYTSGTKYDKIVVNVNQFGVMVCVNEDGKYFLVDEKTGAALADGKTYTNVSFEANPLIKIYDNEGSVTKKGILAPDGKVLIGLTETNGEITVQSHNNLYVEGEYKPAYILAVSYTPKDAQDPVKKYYKIDYTNNTDELIKITEVTEDKLRTTSQDNGVGEVANNLARQNIYNFTQPVINEYPQMDAYNYSINVLATNGDYSNRVLTFYKGNEKTGEVIINNGFTVGFVKNYLYFAEVQILPYDAKSGYNVYEQAGSVTTVSKMKYTYYRYDILKDKVSKYDPGYCILPNTMTAVFNYKDKAADAAIIENAVNYVDGVAVISSKTVYRTYVVDANLKVGADLSNKPFDLSGGLIKLSKNRFLTSTSDEMFLIDDELNIIASVATDYYSVYKNSQLIVCRVSDNYMAIDFDGKIVLEPKYSSLTLYGGYALTDITDFDGTVKTNYLVSKDNIAGTALENMIAENESLLLNSNGIIVKLDQNNKATVYNYAGTEIMSIDDVSAVRVGYSSNDKLYLAVTAASEYSVSTYVLS